MGTAVAEIVRNNEYQRKPLDGGALRQLPLHLQPARVCTPPERMTTPSMFAFEFAGVTVLEEYSNVTEGVQRETNATAPQQII